MVLVVVRTLVLSMMSQTDYVSAVSYYLMCIIGSLSLLTEARIEVVTNRVLLNVRRGIT